MEKVRGEKMSATTIVAASTNTVCLSLLRLRSKHSNGSGRLSSSYTTAPASPPLRQSLWHLRASLSVELFSTLRIPSNCSGFLFSRQIFAHPQPRPPVHTFRVAALGNPSGILVSFAPVDVFLSVNFLTVYTSR